MDLGSIKKPASLFLTALGLFLFIAIIYSVLLISRFAQKPQTVEKSNANELTK